MEPTEDLTRDILTTDLVIDVSTRRAIATITLAPSASEAASFEIGDLDIESVERDEKALPFADRGARLDVAVPASTEPLTLVIEYRYSNHESFDGVSANGYTFTYPDRCGNVFPCHSNPTDGVRFTLYVYGSELPAFYAAEIPFDAPSYMLGWLHAPLAELELGATTAGTQVSAFYDPGEPSGEADAMVGTEDLLSAFDWLELTLGSYHFGSKVGSVSAPWPDTNYTGMEHHPFWHVRQDRMDDPLIHVHEAAHGWFGNGVRQRCWNDLVLSEGIVSYLSVRALEAAGDTAAATAAWENYEAWVDAERYRGPAPAWPEGCDDFDSVSSAYVFLTYARGAIFLRALEQRLGRPELDAALRSFYQTFVGKPAGVSELLASVYLTTGYDPQACAVAWLRGTPLPQFVPCD